MSGTFVISLDFELLWGVRDGRDIDGYGEAILGGRRAIPLMLAAFERFGIRATWATVGLLMCRSRDEMLDSVPEAEPRFAEAGLSSYPHLRTQVGRDEQDDPYHFGASLVDRILDTRGQELATHTHSHYFCGERGADAQSFRADLEAALAVAQRYGVDIRSIVFPRNQVTEDALRICAALEVPVWRGQPDGQLYRVREQRDIGLLLRVLRAGADIAPARLLPPPTARVEAADGLLNVQATAFLRPLDGARGRLWPLQRRRLFAMMDRAARKNGLFHLWWHPHNFGLAPELHMSRLTELLQHFRTLQDRFGMQSRSMGDFAAPRDQNR